jgi:PHD/YefM family antitoxin component YafN of YafNO toxin-antitoxin module
MKVVKFTEVADEVVRAIREADAAEEPTLVEIESRPAAYIVGARQYEELVAERKRLRREALERDVLEAEAEIAAGNLPSFDNADDLIAYLHRDDAECE